ncbi:hypothetical protein J2I47_19380 [Fibrella sp. HMF5335]|uniref:Uncharacterized protein n=1 Tax=Fibrella rubiginis TaxID=2817060 RepID=A0A939K2Z9_9BACT|nr:hypothetical protein [Fibrella rubiginis]MBO0938722.1 hypothetical protein [Fibrella rubiginis]
MQQSPPLVHSHSPIESRFPPVIWAYLCIALVFGFHLFVTVIHPPDGGYFTTDEQFIADSGVFMLYGATPRCLDWPGIPMVVVFYLLGLGQSALNIISAAGHGGLSAVGVFGIIDQTANAYLLDRIPLIRAGRLVQLVLVAWLLVNTIRTIYRADSLRLPPVLRLPLAIILCLQYDCLVWPPAIRPEGLAYALFTCLAVQLLFGSQTQRGWRTILLILTALLLSQRLLFVFTMPFILGSMLVRTGLNWRQATRIVVGLLACLLLTMPFLVTDTLVLLKSFFGGLLMKVNGGAQASFFNWDYVHTMVLPAPTAWLPLLTLLGGAAFWRFYPNRIIAALLTGNLLLLTISIFHSSVIYITHTLPLRTLSVLLLAYGAYGLYRWLGSRAWVLYGATGLIALSNLAESVLLEKELLQPSNLMHATSYANALPANARVLIDATFDNTLARSRKTALRELQALQDPTLTQQKFARQFGSQTSLNVPVSMQTTLLEDDRLTMLQRQVQAQQTPPNRFPDFFLMADVSGFTNYFIDKKQALADFKTGQYDYLVTELPLPYDRLKTFDEPSHSKTYYVYKKPLQPALP